MADTRCKLLRNGGWHAEAALGLHMALVAVLHHRHGHHQLVLWYVNHPI